MLERPYQIGRKYQQRNLQQMERQPPSRPTILICSCMTLAFDHDANVSAGLSLQLIFNTRIFSVKASWTHDEEEWTCEWMHQSRAPSDHPSTCPLRTFDTMSLTKPHTQLWTCFGRAERHHQLTSAPMLKKMVSCQKSSSPVRLSAAGFIRPVRVGQQPELRVLFCLPAINMLESRTSFQVTVHPLQFLPIVFSWRLHPCRQLTCSGTCVTTILRHVSRRPPCCHLRPRRELPFEFVDFLRGRLQFQQMLFFSHH